MNESNLETNLELVLESFEEQVQDVRELGFNDNLIQQWQTLSKELEVLKLEHEAWVKQTKPTKKDE